MTLEPRTEIEEGGQEPPPVRAARPLWQAVVLFGGGLVVFFVVVAFALRTWVVPAMSGASSQPSAAQATLAALQTQEAVRPVATAVSATALAPTAAAAAPVLAPTAAPTSPPAPTAAPTAEVSATSALTAEPTAMPTVSPELAAEVSQAYLQYFQVSADALLNLDPTPLDGVASGDALKGLQDEIAQDRTAGRAIRTDVAHNFVVMTATADRAEVADDYRDSSVFVDPTSKEPLAGEVVPASPEDAPEVKVIYELQRIDGAWKVTGGKRFG